MLKKLLSESPPVLRDFLTYHETIKGHSAKTTEEYFFDLRLFFRFLKVHKNCIDDAIENISIMDINEDFLKKISLSDVYAFLAFLSRERPTQPNSQTSNYGLSAASRARKVATLRSFFKYLTVKAHILQENPVQDLDSPRLKKALPTFLNVNESVQLLSSIDGVYKERDYAIITLFLNCGLRISELQALNLHDVRGDALRVLGKGNKERIVYLNDACILAINNYRDVRPEIPGEKALFISRQSNRISIKTIQYLVKKHIGRAGLDAAKLSAHKLRHTAATLMLQNGVDIRTLQEVLGHEHLNTTQIYTHIESGELRAAAKANPLGNIKPPKKNDSK